MEELYRLSARDFGLYVKERVRPSVVRLVENTKCDNESVHNSPKAYRRKLEGQGSASYTLQLAYNAVRSFLNWNNVKLCKTPRAFIGRTRYESLEEADP